MVAKVLAGLRPAAPCGLPQAARGLSLHCPSYIKGIF